MQRPAQRRIRQAATQFRPIPSRSKVPREQCEVRAEGNKAVHAIDPGPGWDGMRSCPPLKPARHLSQFAVRHKRSTNQRLNPPTSGPWCCPRVHAKPNHRTEQSAPPTRLELKHTKPFRNPASSGRSRHRIETKLFRDQQPREPVWRRFAKPGSPQRPPLNPPRKSAEFVDVLHLSAEPCPAMRPTPLTSMCRHRIPLPSRPARV